MKKSFLILAVLIPMFAMAQNTMRHSLEVGAGVLHTKNYANVMNNCGWNGSIQYAFGPINHLDVVARFTAGNGVDGGLRIEDDRVSMLTYNTYDFRVGVRGYVDFGKIWSAKLTGFLGGEGVPSVVDRYYDGTGRGTVTYSYSGSAFIGGFTLEMALKIASHVNLGLYYDCVGTISKNVSEISLVEEGESMSALSLPMAHTVGLKLGFDL